MRERTAVRLIVCLLVVAMLVGLVPDVALTAVRQEGDNPSAGTDAAVVDAVDDSGAGFGSDEDTPFTTGNVLANDTDSNGDPLSVTAVDTTGTKGRVTDNGDGTFAYDPNGRFNDLNEGETATDTFTYTVSDGHDGTDTAAVTITITGVSDASTAAPEPPSTAEPPSSVAAPAAAEIWACATKGPGGRHGGKTNMVLRPVTGQGECDKNELAVNLNNTQLPIKVCVGKANQTIRLLSAPTTGLASSCSAKETLLEIPNGAPTKLCLQRQKHDRQNGSAHQQGKQHGRHKRSAHQQGKHHDRHNGSAHRQRHHRHNGSVHQQGHDRHNGSAHRQRHDRHNGSAHQQGHDRHKRSAHQQSKHHDRHNGSAHQQGKKQQHLGFLKLCADSAQPYLVVPARNSPPPPAAVDAVDDAFSTDEDTAFTTGSVLTNDSSPNGDPLSVSAVDTTGTTGQVTNNGDGTFAYDPNDQFETLNTGETASDTFTYTVSDGHGNTDTATVTITITGVNDTNAVDDSGAGFGTDENTPLDPTGNVLANDSDPDGDPLSVTALNTAGTRGQVTNHGDGTFAYNPNHQFERLAVGENGSDTFRYTIADTHGNTGAATVTIAITGVNDPPVAVDDTATTDNGTPKTIDVLANDTDPDTSDTLSVSIDPTGTHGLVTVNSDGTVHYNPNGQFAGLGAGATATDTFAYTVSDGHGGTDTATVTIHVTGLQNPPVANDDARTVAEDSGATAFDVLANDSDADGDSLDITNVGDPAGGATAITGAVPNEQVDYTPDADFCNDPGATPDDTFTYTVNDGHANTDTATVSVTVTCVNDAPTAVDDALSPVAEDSSQITISFASLLANDSTGPANESSQTLTITNVANPVGGTVQISGTDVLFTPDANYNGPASFAYTLSDDGTTNGAPDAKTDTGSVSFAIDAVNSKPAITAPATVVTELDTDKVISGVAIADPDADPDAITFTLSVAHGTLTLKTGVAGELAAADITGNGSSSLTVLATQTKINATLADTAGLTYHSEGPPFAGTSDTLNLGTNDGGHNGSGGPKTDAKTVTIQFNRSPTANPQTVSTNEDTARTVTLTATDPEGDSLTFIVTALPASGGALHEGATEAGPLITTVPHPLPGTQVTYVPPANQNGTPLETFSFKANDGSSDSNIAVVTINVTAVNDAPVLANVEGTPLQYTENDAATVISPGITVADVDTTSLISGTVSIGAGFTSAQDTLSYTPPGGNPITGSYNPGSGVLTLTGTGTPAQYEAALRAVKYDNSSNTPTLSRTITFQVDDGQAQNHASNAPTRDITITAVNDAPVLGGVEGITLPYTENDAATVISPGITAADVDSTIATGSVSITSTSGFLAEDVLSYVQAGGNPISGNYNTGTGVLTLTGPGTPAQFQDALRAVKYANSSNAPSTLTRTVTFQVDDGEAANHSSNTQTRNISIVSVNDAPTAQAQTLSTSSSIRVTIGAADTGKLTTGATDPDDPAGDLNVSATFTNVDAGATVTLTDPATGTYTYNPAAGFTGTDTFQYTVCDDGAPVAPQQCSAPTNVTVTIGGTDLWFVDDSAAAGGTGRLTDPFQSLASLPAGRGTGDRIFLFSGTYATGHTLLGSEQLIGQGASGATFDALLGVSVPANGTLDPRPTLGGTAPTLGNTVNLATSAKVQGVAIASTTNTGMTNPAAVTGVAVSQTSITTTTGTALSLNNVGGALDFTDISKNGAGTGISLTNVGAAVTVPAGVIASTTAAGIDIDQGTGAFSYGGTITNASGRTVEVTNRNTGSPGLVQFTGSITSTGGTGVNLDNNDNGTVTFSGGVNLSTGANAAFTATNGGTVNVTGTTNTLATTTGTALNVANTTIGASGLTFKSISANGGASGIVLNNTGTTAGLTVTGSGSTAVGGDNSGGEIQSTSGDGISLRSTTSVSLTNMNIHNTVGDGVGGTGVNGFTFAYGKIDRSGLNAALAVVGAAGTSNIGFNDLAAGIKNLEGSVTITGSNLTNAFDSGIRILNESGTISDLTITNNNLAGTGVDASSDGSGIVVDVNGSTSTGAAVTEATVSGNTINNFFSGAGIQIQGGNATFGPAVTLGTPGSGTNVISITSNVIGNASVTGGIGINGIAAGVTGTGQGKFSITNNGTAGVPIQHFKGIGIAAFGGNQANVVLIVENNVIDASDNIANSSGMSVGSQLGVGQTGTIEASIKNNTINGMEGNGILAGVTNSNNTGFFVIQNNTVGAPQAGVRPGIRVDSGSANGDTTLCLNISGNTSAGSGGSQGVGVRKQGTVATTNDFGIVGLNPSPASVSQTETYVASQNPAGGGALVINGDNFVSCAVFAVD